MRSIRAKQIKYATLNAMYGEVTEEQKEALLKDKQFRRVYRAAKENYHKNKSHRTHAKAIN